MDITKRRYPTLEGKQGSLFYRLKELSKPDDSTTLLLNSTPTITAVDPSGATPPSMELSNITPKYIRSLSVNFLNPKNSPEDKQKVAEEIFWTIQSTIQNGLFKPEFFIDNNVHLALKGYLEIIYNKPPTTQTDQQNLSETVTKTAVLGSVALLLLEDNSEKSVSAFIGIGMLSELSKLYKDPGVSTDAKKWVEKVCSILLTKERESGASSQNSSPSRNVRFKT